jgi:aspartate/methionine/tyrosine aminotransferase
MIERTSRRSGPVAARVRELERHSLRRPNVFAPGVISLASGDPAGLAPDRVVDRLRAAVERGSLGYTHPYGLPRLRERIAAWLAGPPRASATSPSGAAPAVPAPAPPAWERILVTQGASSGLAAIALALLDPGDRVLLPSPTYSLYADVARLAGAVPEFVSARPPGHPLPLEGIAERAAGAAMLVLSNPCNPTGAVCSERDLRELTDIAERHDLLVVVDEAYSSIVYPPARFTSALAIEELDERLVLVDTFSKRLCITGLRLGFVLAPPALARSIQRVHHTLLGPVGTPVQEAVAGLLEEGIGSVDRHLLAECGHRRELVGEALSEVPEVVYRPPDGGFYAFFRVPGLEDSDGVARQLLTRGVAVRPGAEFGPGGEGWLRLSFCGDREELAQGLQRLIGAFPELLATATTQEGTR